MNGLDVTKLFREHAGFVERVLRRAGVPEPDLSDAIQEVFLVVHRRAPEFEGRSQPQTWLYRIAWNVASQSRRRAHRRRELLAPEAANETANTHAPDPAERLERDRSLHALFAAIERLDLDKRETLLGYELDEQPMGEVAQRLGIPLKTAFSRLYAARRALAQALRAQGFSCVVFWRLSPSRALNEPTWRWHGTMSLLSSPTTLSAFACLALLLPGQALEPPATAHPPAAKSAVHAERDPAASAVLPPLQPSAASSTPAAAPPRLPMRGPRRGAQPTAAMSAASESSPTKPTEVEIALPAQLVVVRKGAFDLGLGPFGESPLAHPPLVAPDKHPRAQIVWPGHLARAE